jgi:flagellar P-ring protein precursor FlgI
MKGKHYIAAVAVVVACLWPLLDVQAARIKEMAIIEGTRANQLIGYGLVIGLNGTGDKNNTYFSKQTLLNMLERMGVRADANLVKVNNIAAVMVTADLPPFGKAGGKIDGTVSSIGDAKSLEGGVLLVTPLKGMDGQVYAMGQGSLVVGGFSASGQGASVSKNHPTVGRVPNGVTIERELDYQRFKTIDQFSLMLKIPDFTNTRKVIDSINKVYPGAATASDGGTVKVFVPEVLKPDPIRFISMVENLEIDPDALAKIVVDEKTGTVVIGERVQISTVAISHSNLSVMIKEDQKVSQPMPFARGRTVVTPETDIKVQEDKGHFMVVQGGVTVKELVTMLNSIGASTRDVITILQTIKAAGALHAELQVI